MMQKKISMIVLKIRMAFLIMLILMMSLEMKILFGDHHMPRSQKLCHSMR